MPVATAAVAQPQPKMPRSSQRAPKYTGEARKKNTVQNAMPSAKSTSSGSQ